MERANAGRPENGQRLAGYVGFAEANAFVYKRACGEFRGNLRYVYYGKLLTSAIKPSPIGDVWNKTSVVGK